VSVPQPVAVSSFRRRSLRVGVVAVARPAFKGDADAVTVRAFEWLEHELATMGALILPAPDLVRDEEGAARIAAWTASSELDALLVLHATFATTDLLAPLMRHVPFVGVWAVPEREGLEGRRPGVRPGLDPLPLNSLCGATMTLSALDHAAVHREGPVKWFYGAPGDPVLRRRLAVTTAALHGLMVIRSARILQIGGTAPAFYRVEELPEIAGPHVATAPLGDLYARMAAIEERDVEAHARSWREREPLEAPFEHLLVASRTELALTRWAHEERYDAFAVRCWPEFPEHCGGMACAAMGSLGDHGIPAACEGDVMGALSMLALQAVADAPSALMDLSDLDDDGDRLLVWHCGNAPLALAGAPGTRLTTHFNRDGVGVVRDMALAPGATTGYRLLAGGLSAVVVGGTLADPSLRGFDGVRGWWGDLTWDGERRSAREVVAQILDERLPHHLALAPGTHTEALHELVVLLGGAVLPPRRTRDALVTPRRNATER
jgi:L-fucose isomerase-like protein